MFGQGSGCPERNGRFPVSSQCDAYIECLDGVAEQKLCPDGLFFNTKASFFAYPCQYPSEVDCAGRSTVQPAQPTELCPHQFGYYRVGDAQNCGQFMICASGIGYQFDCPDGLAFSEESLRCDWPDQVPTCDAEAYLGFSCPVNNPNSIFAKEGYRYFRSPSDCQKYFLCYEGRPRRLAVGTAMPSMILQIAVMAWKTLRAVDFPYEEKLSHKDWICFYNRTNLHSYLSLNVRASTSVK